MSAKQPIRNPSVAIVGATGAVGVELIGCLERRNFPLSNLRLFASPRSAGKTLAFRGSKIVVEALDENSFKGIDIALFSAGGETSRKFGPIAVKAGAVVVDNSSAFRMDKDVPLVIPEINGRRIADHKGIIGNPNCAAITAIVPLWPIHRKNRIRRLILSTYQSASGAGAAAMEELRESTRAIWMIGLSKIARCRIPMRSTCSATTRRSIPKRVTTTKRRKSSARRRRFSRIRTSP